MDLLMRIKQLVALGRVAFAQKALDDMARDDLRRPQVVESLLNATFVRTKRSRSPRRHQRHEKVCIVQALSYAGTLIYTKGVIRREPDEKETFYI